MIYKTQKRGLNPKNEPCMSKIERVMAIFLGQGQPKSHYFKFLKSQYLAEFFRQRPNFLHVITIFIGFKMTFCNIGSNKASLLVSQEVALSAPPRRVLQLSQTPGLKGLNQGQPGTIVFFLPWFTMRICLQKYWTKVS